MLSLLDEIDVPPSEIHSVERLLQILYVHGWYDKPSMARARRSLSPRLLLRLDAADRSTFCCNK
jgi:hypothetical protein